MLKFFFNRNALTVKIAELSGLVLLMPATFICLAKNPGIIIRVLFIAFFAIYAFLRACAGFRWYKNAPPGAGIELQFKKALVPTSYIMLLTGILLLITSPVAPLSVGILMFTLIAHVNAILIYLHFQDGDKTPPNFYTSRRFVQNDDAIKSAV
jgi:hypothetical protein